MATEEQRNAGRANLAATRQRQRTEDRPAALTHGVGAFLANGRLPEEIRDQLDAFESGIVSDIGDDPTTAQRTLIASTRIAFGVCLLANAWIAENGCVRRSGRPVPLLNVLGSYLNVVRLNLLALGLERRSKHIGGIDEWVSKWRARQDDAEPPEQSAVDPEPPEAGDEQ